MRNLFLIVFIFTDNSNNKDCISVLSEIGYIGRDAFSLSIFCFIIHIVRNIAPYAREQMTTVK